MSSFLSIEDRGPVRWLTLDRPETRNAVPPGGWDDLAAALTDFASSLQRVLVVRGAGEDFCSGADVLSLSGLEGGVAAAANAMAHTAAAALALHRVPKPTIAAVDGVAVGAGMNLAVGCDVVIATDRARFSEIFVRRGLALDFGGSWLLPRLVGLARARELALTGRIVEAEEALAMGLVARVVPARALEATVTETAGALARGGPLAQRFIKVALDRSFDLTFEQALEMESQAQAILGGSHDLQEAVSAFAEKREPRFEGR
jgi:2-(1,2-epoxy-1,2-dihydrophenyl)acetyl-CoA isomerase